MKTWVKYKYGAKEDGKGGTLPSWELMVLLRLQMAHLLQTLKLVLPIISLGISTTLRPEGSG